MENESQETKAQEDPVIVSDINERVNSSIYAWLQSEIHGSPLSQHTQSWNTLYHALPSLVQRIMAAIEEK